MSQVGPAIIAELKKASPSKGVLRGSFPVGSLANQLAKNGASALSVLTDEEFFHGSLTNLLEASAATELPCLRKDFVVDEFQIIEARAHRADAVLLILAALNDADFRQFLARARELQLDVLCEVHNENELQRALEGGAEIIGVNSRDLRTFEMKPNTLRDLAPNMPNYVLRVAESGISSGSEIGELHNYGYHAFLIGETLMRASDPGNAEALGRSAKAQRHRFRDIRSETSIHGYRFVDNYYCIARAARGCGWLRLLRLDL